MLFEAKLSCLPLLLCALVGSSHGFAPAPSFSLSGASSALYAAEGGDVSDRFEISVAMPPRSSGLQANLAFDSVLSGHSEIVEVRYPLPFGLDVAPKNGLAVCTKDGAGGEKVGDVLRYCSQWTLGLPSGGGIATTVASFSGGVSWQCTMFNAVKATEWDLVVEALVSNEQSRTDEVVLIFERPIEGTAPA